MCLARWRLSPSPLPRLPQSRAASSRAVTPLSMRSVMYVPGDNPKALRKAASLPIDGIMIDFEDGARSKRAARAGALAALAEVDYGARHVVIRVNGVSSPHFAEDMRWLSASVFAGSLGRKVHAVAVPKVESAADLSAVASAVHDVAVASTGAPPCLWAVVETPLGVLKCSSTCADAAAHAAARKYSLQALVAGTSDLAKELQARAAPDRAPLLPSLAHLLLCARAHGLLALDGVSLAVRLEADASAAAAFAHECAQGASLGYDGKTLIHPSQVAAANAAFSPSVAAVERARRIIAAAESAALTRGSDEDGTLVVVDGVLIESLHVADAARLLQLQALIESRSKSPGSVSPFLR